MTAQEFRRVYKVGDVAEERCATKRVYDSWPEAEQAAQLLTEDIRDGKLKRQKQGPITAYKCDCCGLWHIGHGRAPSNPWNDWHRKLVATQARQSFSRQ